ncbi:hypothetical protein [Streptomyces umbrinus]|uniref:hypothetical protein n=1 Tax=Streptomyces umbrinus TaxID=67370 RepID=UPI0033CA4DDF
MENDRDFANAREQWWWEITEELAAGLDDACPDAKRFLPKDLGDPALVRAVLMTRTALRDQRVAAATDIANELYSLWPDRKPPLEDCAGLVADLLRHLHEDPSPSLRSWETLDLWSGLLQLYAARRAAEVGALRAARDLDERWALDPQAMNDGSLDRPLNPGAGWRSFAAHLRATQRDNVTGAALGLLERATVAQELSRLVESLGEHLGAGSHLAALAGQAEAAKYVRRRADELSSGTGAGLWAVVSTAAADYLAVCEGVREGLTTYEQELFRTAYEPEWRDREGMLEAYLVRDSGAGPHPRPLLADPQAHAPSWMTTMVQMRDEANWGAKAKTFTWHSLPGHTPWWFCAVRPGPEEHMAAKLAHDGRVQFEVDKSTPTDLLIGLPDDEPESFLHHLRFRYDETNRDDLCRLLMLATTGWARLDILAARRAGGLRVLQTVRVDVSGEVRDLCGDYAYRRLKEMDGECDSATGEAGYSGGGADLLADEGWGDDLVTYEESPREREAAPVFDGGLFQRDDTIF